MLLLLDLLSELLGCRHQLVDVVGLSFDDVVALTNLGLVLLLF